MARDTVLLLTHRGDFFVPERVAEALERRGARALRVDADTYPDHLTLSSGLDALGRPSGTVAGVPRDALRGLWLRRLWPGPPPEGVSPALGPAIQRERMAHWAAALDLLFDVRQVNRPAAEIAVEGHKLRQLVAARAAGLAVPATLVTNDPAAARAFVEEHGGDVVAKLLTAISTSMDASGPRVRTRRLAPEDIEALDDIVTGPMVFQPFIQGERELRVVWVEGQVFAGAMAGGEDGDWRQGGRGGWLPGAVDDGTRAALDRLMRGLGLSFGAIDIIVPAHGPPVFLEVNPSGEWGMLEAFLDLPVSEAIADALLMEP